MPSVREVQDERVMARMSAYRRGSTETWPWLLTSIGPDSNGHVDTM